MGTFLGGLAVVVMILVLAWAASPPRDDTDPPGGHSGMRLYTDHKTGLQYLSGPFGGGITPRLDSQGRHMKKED